MLLIMMCAGPNTNRNLDEKKFNNPYGNEHTHTHLRGERERERELDE